MAKIKNSKKFSLFSLKSATVTCRAFSLIELSIVLTVIGIIFLSSMHGSELVKTAKNQKANNLTNEFMKYYKEKIVALYEGSYKNSIIVDLNQEVSSWKNLIDLQRGSIGVLAPVSSSNKPTYIYNKIGDLLSSAVNFSGDNALRVSQENSYRELAVGNVFVVVMPDIRITSEMAILDSESGANRSYLGILGNSIRVNFGNAYTVNHNNIVFKKNVFSIINLEFNDDDSYIFFNEPSTKLSVNIGSNTISGLQIGSKADETMRFTGNIAEIIIFDSILPDKDREIVFSYLTKKYIR
jgi:prepilin-type N-terminal cleavage/methylation domain-containing protein